ncbi:MAG: NAD(P)(+) transhydrogenase (Re/Si-specific) subunit beta, partial [Actinomycetota bacterium]|nr:NAD(P)(+) transhydrogenase (Re/Si-specific) subunit beta [Actinomycetota bacterium]
MNQTWVLLAYLVAAVLFILALKGLSSPKTARTGNLLGAGGAVIAVVATLFAESWDHLGLIIAGIV